MKSTIMNHVSSLIG